MLTDSWIGAWIKNVESRITSSYPPTNPNLLSRALRALQVFTELLCTENVQRRRRQILELTKIRVNAIMAEDSKPQCLRCKDQSGKDLTFSVPAEGLQTYSMSHVCKLTGALIYTLFNPSRHREVSPASTSRTMIKLRHLEQKRLNHLALLPIW